MSWMSMFTVALPALGTIAIALRALYERARTTNDESVRFTAAAFRQIAFMASAVACVAQVGLALSGPAVRASTGIDGLSMCFLVLTAAVWPAVVSAAGQCDRKSPAMLYGLLLLLESTFFGLFATVDAVLFCLFLQASTLNVYLLIGVWGGRERQRAARKFLLFNLCGDMLLLLGLLGVMVAAARMANSPAGGARLTSSLNSLMRDLPRMMTDDAAAQEYWNHARSWILTAFIVGLAIKTPLVPFHAWFVSSVAEGPQCVGLALLGVGLRVSTYAFVRFVGPLCGDFGSGTVILVGLISLGALHEGLLALAHHDMRKMAACTGLSQAAIAIAGCFSLEIAGTIGAVLLSIAGGFASAALLFGFGILERRFDAREMSAFGGIARRLPQTSAVLLVAVFAIVGSPGLSGFVGLFPTLSSIFDVSWLSTFLALLAGLIVAWALFWMLQSMLFGSLRLPQSFSVGNGSGVAAEGSGVFSLFGVWTNAAERNTSADDKLEEAAPDLRPTDWDGPVDWNRPVISPIVSGATGEKDNADDLSPAQSLAVAPILAGIFLLGIRPQAVVDFIQASVHIGIFLP